MLIKNNDVAHSAKKCSLWTKPWDTASLLAKWIKGLKHFNEPNKAEKNLTT